MASGKVVGLGLLAAVLGTAVSVNGFLVYRAFRSSEVHYQVVVKASDNLDPRLLKGELRDVPGVGVTTHEHPSYKRKLLGHYWLGMEEEADLARSVQQQLQRSHYPASIETVDDDKCVVHLQQEYPSEAAAARARPAVEQRAVLTVKPMQAFRVERSTNTTLDIMVPDSEHAKTVQAIVSKHNLTVETVTDDQ